MSTMTAVPAMTEHVQQRTGEKEQPRQNSQDVSPVFGEEQCSPHDQECEEDETAS